MQHRNQAQTKARSLELDRALIDIPEAIADKIAFYYEQMQLQRPERFYSLGVQFSNSDRVWGFDPSGCQDDISQLGKVESSSLRETKFILHPNCAALVQHENGSCTIYYAEV